MGGGSPGGLTFVFDFEGTGDIIPISFSFFFKKKKKPTKERIFTCMHVLNSMLIGWLWGKGSLTRRKTYDLWMAHRVSSISTRLFQRVQQKRLESEKAWVERTSSQGKRGMVEFFLTETNGCCENGSADTRQHKGHEENCATAAHYWYNLTFF